MKIRNTAGKKDLWDEYCQNISDGGINLMLGVPDRKYSKHLMWKLLIPMIKLITTKNWFDYSTGQGDENLRNLISKKIGFKAKNIVITSGSQQGLLMAILEFSKKNTIMVERLSYVGIEKIGKDFSAGIVGFSGCLNEMSEQVIESEIKKNKPGLVYVVADFSNPMGTVLSREKRKFLVKLAKKYKFVILEDQTYRDLFYKKGVILTSMSEMSDRVVVLGSMSKIMFPGVRVGWVAVKDDQVVKNLIAMKNAMDLSTGYLNQLISAIFLEEEMKNGKFLSEVREIYRKRMIKLADGLKKNNKLTEVFVIRETPKGGFYYWLDLKKPENISKFVAKCFENGIAIAKGDVFDYSGGKLSGVRLSIANVDIQKIDLAVEGLFKAAATVDD
jgi:2-aminoadipate transaminase